MANVLAHSKGLIMTTSRFPEAEGRQALSVRQINAIIRELIDGADRRLDDEHADRQAHRRRPDR
jgi:hypothetical protein